MNDQVAGYRDLVESLARKFVGRNGAEFDDLVQEGLINVWQTLEREVVPRAEIIEGRMRDWVRLLGTQIGRGRGVEYAQLLPLEQVVARGDAGEELLLLDILHAGNAIDPRLDPIPLPGHDPLA